MRVKKNIAIKGFKMEIENLEERLKTLLPQGEEEKINTDSEQGFQLLVRVKCVKSNLTVLRDQLAKLEEA